MRVSDSILSRKRASTSRLLVPGVALAYLIAHLPFLAPSLEDIDSINFALGLHHFDLASHQPHPPGYPMFVLAAKATGVSSARSTFGTSSRCPSQ